MKPRFKLKSINTRPKFKQKIFKNKFILLKSRPNSQKFIKTKEKLKLDPKVRRKNVLRQRANKEEAQTVLMNCHPFSLELEVTQFTI